MGFDFELTRPSKNFWYVNHVRLGGTKLPDSGAAKTLGTEPMFDLGSNAAVSVTHLFFFLVSPDLNILIFIQQKKNILISASVLMVWLAVDCVDCHFQICTK